MPRVALADVDGGLAETIILHDCSTSFIVSPQTCWERSWYSKYKEPKAWVAEWWEESKRKAHVIEGESKNEVINEMTDKIKRIKVLRELERMMEERRIEGLKNEARNMANGKPRLMPNRIAPGNRP